MADQKHLTLEQRNTIQEMLTKHYTFTKIGKALNKHPSTISKEICGHLVFVRSGFRYVNYNACAHRSTCSKTHLCATCHSPRNFRKCSRCSSCNRLCPDFSEVICSKLLKPPYVCNGCGKRTYGCTLEKRYYYASAAQKEYLETLSESRSGISLTEEELRHLDDLISPLLRQNQSPHHICVTNADELMISESTVYRLVDSGVLTARNLDLPRKVRFRQRKKTVQVKVDKSCRIGRKYTDFQEFMKEHPGHLVVELDSVEGIKGGYVLLTIHFVKPEMMLAFLREHNDSRSVTMIFEDLYSLLGHERFTRLFPVCLADNGSEFSNPRAIEFNSRGEQRTHVFYCDPNAPYQKASAERNHEFIRRFLPKGTDLSRYTQDDIRLMMDHINSYSRGSIGNKCPYEMFAFLYGQDVLDLLECHRLPPQSIALNRSIFSREVQA